MEEDKYELLHLLEDVQQNCDILYQTTMFWRNANDMLTKNIINKGVENFRKLLPCLNMFVPSYSMNFNSSNTALYEKVKNNISTELKLSKNNLLLIEQLVSGQLLAQNDYNIFLATDIDKPPYISNVSESNIGEPINQHEFNNKKFSRSLLNYLLGINFLKKHIDTSEIKTVFEIGGGFGTLAEILLHDPRNDIFYLDFDIPPVSFVSSYYLKQLLGKRFLNYKEICERKIDISDIHKYADAAVVPAFEIENIQLDCDLFVNFISFQEMEPNIVENYLKHIKRVNTKYILLRNIKEGKNPQKVETPITSDYYDRYLPDYELVATNVLPFGYRTPDGFNSELRLYKRK